MDQQKLIWLPNHRQQKQFDITEVFMSVGLSSKNHHSSRLFVPDCLVPNLQELIQLTLEHPLGSCLERFAIMHDVPSNPPIVSSFAWGSQLKQPAPGVFEIKNKYL